MRADLDATAIAAQILAMLDGLILQWALEPGSLDVVAAMREYVRTLRRPRLSAVSSTTTRSGGDARRFKPDGAHRDPKTLRR